MQESHSCNQGGNSLNIYLYHPELESLHFLDFVEHGLLFGGILRRPGFAKNEKSRQVPPNPYHYSLVYRYPLRNHIHLVKGFRGHR